MIGEIINQDRYLDHKALGSTAIRIAAQKSVAHYRSMEKTSTPSQSLGTMAHTMILEPETFGKRYVVGNVIRCHGETKTGSQCLKKSIPGTEFCSVHGGKEKAEFIESKGVKIITEDESENIFSLSNSVRSGIDRYRGSDGRPLSWILDQSSKEVSIFGKALFDGDDIRIEACQSDEPASSWSTWLLVRGRIDMLVEQNLLAMDLKGTSRGVDPRMFRYHILDYGLHVQAALYLELLKAHTGKEFSWAWIAHEMSEPYAVRIYEPLQSDIEAGWEICCEGLRRWKEFFMTGDMFAGWPKSIEEIGL
jgi:hypothetical protein